MSSTTKTYKCIQCDKESQVDNHHKVNKFCSNECQHRYRRSQTFTRLIEGKITGRDTIRSTLIYQFGNKCMECDLSEWRGQSIPLEVDHIDGNAGNNEYKNLRLLCPNCHGITSTWKGRNKGNGRASRGLKLS